jgi:alkylhydroperoxidase family enzyme
MPRLPLLNPESLSPELRVMLEKWRADGGDPNFILTFARLPETLARFVAFYSPLVRRGKVEHRTKELARLRLAQLNECQY